MQYCPDTTNIRYINGRIGGAKSLFIEDWAYVEDEINY